MNWSCWTSLKRTLTNLMNTLIAKKTKVITMRRLLWSAHLKILLCLVRPCSRLRNLRAQQTSATTTCFSNTCRFTWRSTQKQIKSFLFPLSVNKKKILKKRKERKKKYDVVEISFTFNLSWRQWVELATRWHTLRAVLCSRHVNTLVSGIADKGGTRKP